MGSRASKVTARGARADGSGSGSESTGGFEGSKARRVAFRVVAILTSLLLVAYFVFALVELVLMWLPDETLEAMFASDTADILSHRSHFMSVGIVAWAMVLPAVVQIRQPARRVAPMLQLVVITLGAGVVYALSGTVGEWLAEELVLLVPVLLLAALHPRARELLRRPTFDRSLAALAGLASLPWLAFVVTNARLQWLNAAGDSHAEMEHWATSALMGIVVVATAFLGSTDHDGWRLPAWCAAAASVIFGLHSLVFGGVASALSPVWAVAAIVWGLAFGVAVVRRARLGHSAS